MSIPYRPSSPIRQGFPPVETRKAIETYTDVCDQKLIQRVTNEGFLQAYLSEGQLNLPEWLPEEQTLVAEIQSVQDGCEESLYTGSAPPLLRLLNSISKRVFDCLTNAEREALVFYSGHKCEVQNPFNKLPREPDVVALWKEAQSFPEIDYSRDRLTPTTWCTVVAVGEVKISTNSKSKDGRFQLANYLQNHLQLHPELNALLGFTARRSGYALFYHDANVIHRTNFRWDQPGPLYAFVEKLYTRPFQDISMKLVNAQNQPTVWATKIGTDVYISEAPRVLAGPGQRRYTATAINFNTSARVFLKDIWRDKRRLFFEALLFKQAHAGQPLPGLMQVDSHGYVLDEHGKRVRTLSYSTNPTEGHEGERHKMRIMTKDIGRPLGTVRSLRQFLCVMYDACAVQRNLYRKCRILHRDISDGNIMVAPDTEDFRQRCAKGYNEVKYVNQVLAKDKNSDPKPACLVIDLGNGADLKAERKLETLTERTGTPKFIARSVSSGLLLEEDDFPNRGVEMPTMEGSADAYAQFMHTSGYQAFKDLGSASQSEVQFGHQLFHDAESTFWVIAWTLARSTREPSKPEINPHERFRTFFHTMARHYPTAEDDTRSICKVSEAYWKSILHPDLANLSKMLSNMFKYVHPEWAYRPDLDPEHVHEALMRSLLTEIVHLDESKSDIPLVIGERAIPRIPQGMPLHRANTTSIQASLSHPSISLEPQRESPAGARSDNVAASDAPGSTQPQTTQPDDGSQELKLGPAASAEHDHEAPTARDQLIAQVNLLKWHRESCELGDPESKDPK